MTEEGSAAERETWTPFESLEGEARTEVSEAVKSDLVTFLRDSGGSAPWDHAFAEVAKIHGTNSLQIGLVVFPLVDSPFAFDSHAETVRLRDEHGFETTGTEVLDADGDPEPEPWSTEFVSSETEEAAEPEPGLSDEQRAMLVGPDARMEGYYIDFTPTGVAEIDQVLSAVAWAGKGAHSTDIWTDELDYTYGPVPQGKSFNWLIQAAADDAAARLTAGSPKADGVTPEEAWQEGVDTALNHAIRNPDGVTLRLERPDGEPWVNPHASADSASNAGESRDNEEQP